MAAGISYFRLVAGSKSGQSLKAFSRKICPSKNVYKTGKSVEESEFIKLFKSIDEAAERFAMIVR